MRPNKISLSIIGVLSIGLWGLYLTQKNNQMTEQKVLSSQSEPVETNQATRALAQKSMTNEIPKSIPLKPLTEDEFIKKYSEAEIVWGESQKLESIRVSSVHLNDKTREAFNPMNKSKVLSRARQILEESAFVLGLQNTYPLENPQFSLTELGAQVVFQQTYNGHPILPAGTVSIIMDDQGGLKGLYSTYIQAPEFTQTIFSRPSSSQKVYWNGKAAYYEQKFGFIEVTDAQTGQVIHTKNTKVY